MAIIKRVVYLSISIANNKGLKSAQHHHPFSTKTTLHTPQTRIVIGVNIILIFRQRQCSYVRFYHTNTIPSIVYCPID